MRRWFLVISVLFFASYTIRAEAYQGIYGIGFSDTKTNKASGTLGIASEEWAFSMGFIFNSEYNDKDFQDTPIPHTDYENLGEKRIGTTIGMDVLRSFRIAESNFSIFTGGGLYFSKTANLVRSNVTGWLWAQNKSQRMDLGFEVGGFLGQVDAPKFGVSYHTVKGIVFYLRAGNF